jgi:hypothetical protein
MFILIPIIVLGTTGIVVIEVKKRRSILWRKLYSYFYWYVYF